MDLIFVDALDPSHLVVADGPAYALRLSVLQNSVLKVIAVIHLQCGYSFRIRSFLLF